MSFKKCSYYSCSHKTGTHPKLRYFRFPTDKKRSDMWLQRCHNDQLNVFSTAQLATKVFVCECHFLEEDFTNALRKRLNKSAVPIQAVLPLDDSELTIYDTIEEADVRLSGKEDVQAGPNRVNADYNAIARNTESKVPTSGDADDDSLEVVEGDEPSTSVLWSSPDTPALVQRGKTRSMDGEFPRRVRQGRGASAMAIAANPLAEFPQSANSVFREPQQHTINNWFGHTVGLSLEALPEPIAAKLRYKISMLICEEEEKLYK